MARRPVVVWVATALGAGLSPFAPGTMGSLAALVLWWPLLGTSAYSWVWAAAAIAGVPLCGRAARALGRPDPPAVVWDEVVGMGVTLWGIPASPLWVAAGFGLFRLFDIAKPPPLRILERLPGGFGIMADDVGAGVYARLLLGGLLWLAHGTRL
ncbi:MAG: phosphatidylglycerophosphatase A [Gammaproteobacteria bacterium]|nr:phosphatidylglycerophosphatase A [Gammaproteobacteria bacterium]